MKTTSIKLGQILMPLAAMLVLLGAATRVQATSYTFNVSSGAWNVAANWSPSTGYPGSADTAIIPTGKSVTGLGGSSQACTTLTIQGTGSLTVDANTLTVSGTITVGTSGAATLTIASGATLNHTSTASGGLAYGGTSSVLTNNGTYTDTAGFNYTGTTPIFGNNGTATFSGANQAFNGTISVIQGPSGILNLNGSQSTPIGGSVTLNASAVGNTVNYGYAGAQNLDNNAAITYYNLTFSGSGAKSFGGNKSTVNGTLSLQGTATASGAGNVIFGASSTLEYKGTSAQTPTATEWPASSAAPNVTINNSAGVTLPSSFARTNSGTLTLASGSFANSASVLTLGSGANIIRTAGSLTTVPTFSGTVNVTYNNTSATTTGFELPTSTGNVLNNLTNSDAAGITLGGTATVNGTFAVTSYNGTTTPVAAGANVFTFKASPVVITTTSQLAAGAYTIVSGSAVSASSLGALTVNGSGVNGTPTIAITGNQLMLTVASGGSSTISYSGTSFAYNGAAQSPTIIFSGSTGAKTTNYFGTGYSGINAPTNAGSYTVSNTVAANGSFTGATNSQSFTITQATNMLALSSSINPSASGLSVTFTAAVQTNGVTTTLATSNVVFKVNSSPVATNALSSGLATYSSTFTSGSYSIMAIYSGDNNYQPSTNTLTQTVTAPVYSLNVTNATSGAWTNPATWVSGQIPIGTNNVYILTGTTITSLGANESCSNLTVQDSGSLNVESGYTLTVSNILTMGSSSGIAYLTNSGTVNVNGTGSSFVFVDGSFLTNTAGSIFNCAGGNGANANATWTFGNNGTATFTGATIPFDTGYHNASVVQGPNGVLNLNNSVAAFGNSATLNATAVGNTVNYGYAGAQSVATQSGTASYYNLTLSGSGAKTGNATVNGTLSLQGTATCGNTITYGAGATLTYAGSVQQTTTANELPSGGVPNLTINNGNGVLLGGNSSVSSLLTLTAGILNLNGHTLSAGTVIRTAGSILLTPTVTLNNKVYDGTTAATTIATRLLAGTLTGDSGNVTLGTSGTVSAFSSANVGSYTPSVTGLALSGPSSANYSLSTTSVSPGANITKATASVTMTPYNVTYDGNAHTATAGTVTGVNGETGATVGTVTLTGTTHTAAGTYATDSWTLTGGANYNNISAQTITDTIGKATASVTVTPYNVTYDGNAHTATAGTVTGVNGETGAMVGTVDLSGTTHTAVGTYASDSWSLTGGANYNNIGATTITDTISHATPSFSDLSSVTNSYGVTSLTLTGTVSAAGSLYPADGETVSATINGFIVNGTVTDGMGDFSITFNDPSLATNGVAGSPYTIAYNYAGNANLAATADTSTALTITNAPLGITANDDSKCYGDTKIYGVGSTAFVSTGLVNGETIGTVTITATDSPSGEAATDPAGTYDLTPSAATGGTFDANNYLIVYNNGTLTVNSLPTTSAITGPNTIASSSTATYSVTPTAGSIYSWTVPLDATFTGGMGNSISVTFGSTSGNVSVTETSSSGCVGMPQSEYVTVASGCTAPVIVGGIDPDSVTLCAGSPLVLTLTNTTGMAPLFYQWQTNGVDILDATNASYTNLSVTLADMTNYVCVVSNSCGMVTSLVATVTVNPLLTVSVNTEAICAGDSATLTATTSASNPSYQWNDPDNSTTASITVSPSSTTTYTVTVTDGVTGCANSSSGTVTVNSVIANDVTYNATIGYTFKVAETDLLAHASGSDGVALIAVQSPSANGVTITNSDSQIFYLANVTNTDTFTYTVASMTGGCAATGTVTLNPIHPVGSAQMGIPTNGVVTIKFFGIPGTNYVVETATNIIFTPYWPLSTNTAGSDGSWLFTDPNATNQQQYYRSTWKP